MEVARIMTHNKPKLRLGRQRSFSIVGGRRVEKEFSRREGERLGTSEREAERDRARREPRRERRRERDREERPEEPIRLGFEEERPEEVSPFDLRAQIEAGGVKGKAIEIATSLKTTAVLGTILASLVTFGGGLGATSLTAGRSTVGKGGSVVTKELFRKVPKTANVATRFPANAKSASLTRSFLTGTGMTVGAAGVALTVLGSYPFAGFIKEEALQTLGFAVNTASKNEDIEGMELAISEQAEILDPTLWKQILDAVPYANVLSQLKTFYKAATTKLEIDNKTLEKLRAKQAAPAKETFEESSKRLATERRETELTEREEDTAFFEQQREEGRERELAQREEDRQFFAQIAEESALRKQEEREADEVFFARIRAETDARAKAGDEKARQDTLFFEAIRKRNAGIRLTEEEIALLESRGASRDLFGQAGQRGRSTVRF